MITANRFSDEVLRSFAYLTDEFGFELGEQTDYAIRYERDAVYVSINYDATRSREISVWIGDETATEPPLELPDLLRATDSGGSAADDVALMQTADADAAARLLSLAADHLRSRGRAFLAGRPEAFAKARWLRSERAAEYTQGIKNRHVLGAADEAWATKDFGRVHDLLNPIRDSLTDAYLRRLKVAEKRL
jgi:hypothetical protein